MALVIVLWALVGLLQISNSRAELEKPVLEMNPGKNFSSQIPQDMEREELLCDDIVARNVYQKMDLLNTANEVLRLKLDALKMDNKLHFREIKEVLDGFGTPPELKCTQSLEKIRKEIQDAVEIASPRATLPSNCAEALQRTTAPKDGPQLIQIPNSKLPPFYVYCKVDPQHSGGPWTIIQRRKDGSIDFYRGWNEYQRGFGNLEGEFFLGLDRIHALTHSALHELWIEMEDFNNNTRWAKYSTFAVTDESNGYALNMLGSFSGDAGDSLTNQAGQKFTTHDRDNDRKITSNCAEEYRGAWWYKACHNSNLNGLYLKGVYPTAKYAQGIDWDSWLGHQYSLKYVHMAIRPVAQPAIQPVILQ